MGVDAVGLQGMKDQIRKYLNEINLNNVTRKEHNKIMWDIGNLFAAIRSIQHKKILVN